jgi:hypothetical protein
MGPSRPANWKKIRSDAKHANFRARVDGTSALLRYIIRPFFLLLVLLEWGSEWLVFAFRRYVVLQILTIIPVIVGLIASGIDVLDRPQERILRAWQVIAASPDAQGNIGQREALTFLVKKGVNVQHLYLRKAYLVGINLSRVDLRGTDFYRAKMHNANLNNADLRGSNLREAELGHANLNNANLNNANLSRVNLSNVDLRGSNLREAELGRANLSNANLSNADLRGSNLTQKQLHEACVDEKTTLPKGLTIDTVSQSHLEECANLWR